MSRPFGRATTGAQEHVFADRHVSVVAPDLLPILLHGLAPGGILVIEEHLQWAGPEQISGPSSQRFRVTADELSTQLGAVGVGFDVLNEFSGLIAEPTDEGEQGKAAVSRMCIRRRST